MKACTVLSVAGLAAMAGAQIYNGGAVTLLANTTAGVNSLPPSSDAVYSNLTNDSGQVNRTPGYDNSDPLHAFSYMIVSSVTQSHSTSAPITGVTWDFNNWRRTTLNVAASVAFYNVDPSTGLPSTLIAGINFDFLTIAPTQLGGFMSSDNLAPLGIVLPQTYWIGQCWRGGQADVTGCGTELYNAPTVGSRTPFYAIGAGTGVYPSGPNDFFVTNSNFGTGMEVRVAVPEPCTLVALAGLGLLTIRRRRRR